MDKTNSNGALIIGANGAIGRAIIQHQLKMGAAHVFAISRHFATDYNKVFDYSAHLHTRVCDYSETAIKHIVDELLRLEVCFDKVFICNGKLHDEQLKPEKRLEDFNPLHFAELIHVNVTVPTLWLKHLPPLFYHKQQTTVTVLSARVGSIEDNRLGGWYSYRSSKSALNMVMKNTGIEYARRAKNVKLIAFHPGTTDSALSKPFQHNVPVGKLFAPSFVAERLFDLLENVDFNRETLFVDWQGNPIPW